MTTQLAVFLAFFPLWNINIAFSSESHMIRENVRKKAEVVNLKQ